MKIKNAKDKLITLALGTVLIILMYLLDLPCLFKLILPVGCPGCGLTRAYLSLLHLDLKAAFTYHPLFWSAPIGLLYYLYDGNLFQKKWLDNSILIILTTAFLALWIYRMVTGTTP